MRPRRESIQRKKRMGNPGSRPTGSTDDYGVELEYDHVGIHLFFDQRGPVMLYSEEPDHFAVDIQLDSD